MFGACILAMVDNSLISACQAEECFAMESRINRVISPGYPLTLKGDKLSWCPLHVAWACLTKHIQTYGMWITTLCVRACVCVYLCAD